MTLNELRYIVALAEERHFGRAARRCRVGQSTLSMAVRRLEEELETPLFERDSRGVRSTPVGAAVVARARRALLHCETIVRLADSPGDPLQGPLTLGASADLAPCWLPRLLAHLAGAAPLIPRELSSDLLEQALVRGELDAALVTLPFASSPELVTCALFDEPLMVLMPHQHPLSTRTALEPHELLTAPLLLTDGAVRKTLLASCPALAEAPNTAPHQASADTLRQMVAQGLGITVLPRSAVGPQQLPGALTARPFFAPAPGYRLALAWRKNFARPRAIDYLIEALRTCHRAHWPEPNAQEDAIFMANRHW